jgi:hypothetical protein
MTSHCGDGTKERTKWRKKLRNTPWKKRNKGDQQKMRGNKKFFVFVLCL